MPLPSVKLFGARQCKAKAKRTGSQCLNPSAYGMPTCRYHGARKKVLCGKDHPNFIHGQASLAAKREYNAAAVRLRDLEEEMHVLNMTSAKLTPGRKPKRV